LVPGSNPGGPSFISEFIFAAQSSESNFALKILFGRIVRGALIALEIAILSVLILATRCANYQDVFVAGNVYFTDADCYARMTRVRMCAKNPGLVIRRHNFENFPRGTTPHTTAPLDYLILALAITLKPFTTHGIDLAGALISPMFALLGGWFLWWWAWRMKFRYRWMMLSLYAISPILVHGNELGRPDHQSLLLLLVTIAICAEWSFRSESAPGWSRLSGIAWGLAIWVSAYEPLVLFGIVVAVSLVQDRQVFLAKSRRTGWISFALIIAVAALVERRIPSMSIFSSNEIFNNWAHTIGELAHVSPLNPIWFSWAGYMIAVAPLLIWFALRRRNGAGRGQPTPPLIIVLLVASYLLTIWQARWAYFFCLDIRDCASKFARSD
jgi:asparagine N-glycosylation enzyme membrane subunit Stt3